MGMGMGAGVVAAEGGGSLGVGGAKREDAGDGMPATYVVVGWGGPVRSTR